MFSLRFLWLSSQHLYFVVIVFLSIINSSANYLASWRWAHLRLKHSAGQLPTISLIFARWCLRAFKQCAIRVLAKSFIVFQVKRATVCAWCCSCSRLFPQLTLFLFSFLKSCVLDLCTCPHRVVCTKSSRSSRSSQSFQPCPRLP